MHVCLRISRVHCLRQPVSVPGLELQKYSHVGPVREQQVFLIAEPSLQAFCTIFEDENGTDCKYIFPNIYFLVKHLIEKICL